MLPRAQRWGAQEGKTHRELLASGFSLERAGVGLLLLQFSP